MSAPISRWMTCLAAGASALTLAAAQPSPPPGPAAGPVTKPSDVFPSLAMEAAPDPAAMAALMEILAVDSPTECIRRTMELTQQSSPAQLRALVIAAQTPGVARSLPGWLDVLFEAYVRADTPGALELFLPEQNAGPYGRYIQGSPVALQILAQTQPELLLQAWQSLPPGAQSRQGYSFSTIWGRSPRAVALNPNPAGFDPRALATAVLERVQPQGVAAVQAAWQGLPDELKHTVFGDYVAMLSQNDPALAYQTFLAGLTTWRNANAQHQTVQNLFVNWVRLDPDGAFRQALALDARLEPRYAWQPIFESLLRRDAAAAAKLVPLAPAGALRQLGTQHDIVSEWMRTDPIAALEWHKTALPDDLRPEQERGFNGTWNLTPAQCAVVADWLLRQPPQPQQPRQLSNLLNTWAAGRPQSYGNQLSGDPGAALDWFEQHREELRARLGTPPQFRMESFYPSLFAAYAKQDRAAALHRALAVPIATEQAQALAGLAQQIASEEGALTALAWAKQQVPGEKYAAVREAIVNAYTHGSSPQQFSYALDLLQSGELGEHVPAGFVHYITSNPESGTALAAQAGVLVPSIDKLIAADPRLAVQLLSALPAGAIPATTYAKAMEAQLARDRNPGRAPRDVAPGPGRDAFARIIIERLSEDPQTAFAWAATFSDASERQAWTRALMEKIAANRGNANRLLEQVPLPEAEKAELREVAAAAAAAATEAAAAAARRSTRAPRSTGAAPPATTAPGATAPQGTAAPQPSPPLFTEPTNRRRVTTGGPPPPA